jgi:hypothetical protein
MIVPERLRCHRFSPGIFMAAVTVGASLAVGRAAAALPGGVRADTRLTHDPESTASGVAATGRSYAPWNRARRKRLSGIVRKTHGRDPIRPKLTRIDSSGGSELHGATAVPRRSCQGSCACLDPPPPKKNRLRIGRAP